jgi:hypothetical protein
MDLNENILRIKQVMRIINEQSYTDLKSYLDELLKDPESFVNKLNTDDQFKNAYGTSYKNPNVDWKLLEETKLRHILKNREINGVVKNKETNQIIRELSIKNIDEYNEIIQNKVPNETIVLNVGKLEGTSNGSMVAQALNLPLQIYQNKPDYIWFK